MTPNIPPLPAAPEPSLQGRPRAVLVLAATLLAGGSAHGQDLSAARLAPDRPVAGVFKSVETGQDAADPAHRFALPEQGGNVPWRLELVQSGVDLRLVEWRDGQVVGELNHHRDRFEREIFRIDPSVDAVEVRPVIGGEQDGAYRLSLLPTDGEDPERRRIELLLTDSARIPHGGSATEIRTAAEAYEAAAADLAALPGVTEEDLLARAQALLGAANHRRVLGEAEHSVALYGEAAELFRRLDDPGMLAASLVGVGQGERRRGRLPEARTALDEALELFDALGNREREVAQTESNLGLIAQIDRDYPRALDHYDRALESHRAAGRRLEVANVLLNRGSVHARLGNADGALVDMEQSLGIFRDLGDRRAELDALSNLGTLHRRMSDLEQALELYAEADRLAKELGDARLRGRILNNRGYTYMALGDFDRAVEDFEQGNGSSSRAGDRVFEMVSRKNLAEAHYYRGDLDSAQVHWTAALKAARRLKHRSEAEILAHLGRLGAKDAADRGYFRQAWERVPDAAGPEDRARLHGIEGEAHLERRDGAEAERSFAAALELWAEAGNDTGRILALVGLAEAERIQGRPGQAREHLEEAVVHIESLRLEMTNPNLRAAFLGARHRAYDLLVDTLVDLDAREPGRGLRERALEVAERAKGRRLLDLLLEPTSDDPTVTELRRERLETARRLALSTRRRTLVKQGRQRPVAGENLDASITDLRAHLDLLDGRIRRLDPRREVLEAPPPPSTAAMRTLLDPGTALLHYVLGDARSHLFVLTPEALHHFTLPPRAELEENARRLHEAWGGVGGPSRTDEKAAAALAEQLAAPARSVLEVQQRLVVMADGALHYVPFSALPWSRSDSRRGEDRWIHRFEMVRIPSTAVLAAERRAANDRAPRPARLAVIADPVFDRRDPRLPREDGASGTASAPVARARGVDGVGALGRLPGSGVEARVIAGHLPADRSRVTLGFDADRRSLERSSAEATILHLATHGLIDIENPELSGLVLSQFHADGGRRTDGFLRLFDIYELELDLDLVVLSGCRTALGRELDGEAFRGLASGFLHAGARRVMASLWPIADRATADLMDRFYRAFLGEGLAPAAALRRAQIAMAGDRRYADPYYWAGFVLQGDWR